MSETPEILSAEQVKALRDHAADLPRIYADTRRPMYAAHLLNQAADAIEQLQAENALLKRSLALLAQPPDVGLCGGKRRVVLPDPDAPTS